MNCSGILTYGIVLPPTFNTGELSAGEFIEEVFYPYKGKTKYPNLEAVPIGYCDNDEWIISTVNHSVEWTSVALELDELEPKHFNELEQFCKDFDIDYDPNWYLGCYYG